MSFFAIIFDRFSKRLERWPASFYSIIGSGSGYFIYLAPLGERFRDAINGYIYTASFIIGLLFNRCPTAIFRRVITVIINTVNRISWRWSFPHVFKKIWERMPPTLAHFYSTTAVFIPTRTIDIFSSINNAAPSIIKLVARFPMCFMNFAIHIRQETTTRACVAINEFCGLNDYFFPTIATAQPHNPIISIVLGSFDDGKASKHFAGQIFKACHNLFFKASTRLCMTIFQLASAHYRNLSAIAKASPFCATVFIVIRSKYCGKFSEFLASEIYKGGHDSYPPLDIPYVKVWRADTDFSLSPVGLATWEV